jgi:hypothetical protein
MHRVTESLCAPMFYKSVIIFNRLKSWFCRKFFGGVWAFIDIDLSQISGKAKRINITIPERVLSLIDLYAKNHAIKNRSSFLADAALSYMESHK